MEISKNILLVDKPAGMTSFDVIRRLRTIFAGVAGKPPKLGHAGTLDPMATGLLLIGVGKGTKELHNLLKLPKTYEARILLGKATDTGDSEGRVIERHSAAHLSDEKIRLAVSDMIGEHRLAVPAYSAIKQGGEPLYKKARRGEKVQPPVKEMVVIDALLLGLTASGAEKELYVRFEVTSGTYIRTLAEELGRRLKVPAMLSGLRRTKIGRYDIAHAKTIEDFERKEKESGWIKFFRKLGYKKEQCFT